jgi:AcrR family transcriptional regulator
VADRVKRHSPNHGQGGQARTRFARRAVIDAARALFLERGYVATTIDAISERSDVPAATVYRLFSSKLGILHALLDTSIAGDDQPVPMQQRPDVAGIFAESDPGKLLADFVGIAVAINTRSNDLYRILSSAAVSDPAAAELFADYQRQRADGQGRVARSLARARALPSGLRERDAADLIHALVSPELYRLLVVDRAWPLDRYEKWLVSTLSAQLTAASSPPERSGH